MLDKLIVRAVFLVLVIFIMLAVFYKRPALPTKTANYLPANGFIGSEEEGRKLFNNNCIVCHGAGLTGTNQGPSLLHDYYKPDHHSDISVYLAVFKGVKQHHWQFGNMPAVPGVRPEQVAHIIKYIRARQREIGLY